MFGTQRQHQEELVRMVLTLRVLGKFLGYVDFISYQTNGELAAANNENMSQLAVSSRQQV